MENKIAKKIQMQNVEYSIAAKYDELEQQIDNTYVKGVVLGDENLTIVKGDDTESDIALSALANSLSKHLGKGGEWGIRLMETSSTDWAGGYPLGNWDAWEEYKSLTKRVFLDANDIAHILKTDDATKLASGETYDQMQGDVMTIAPALYGRVTYEESEGCNVLWLSMSPNGGFVIETDKINHLCVYGTYLAYSTGGKLHSWKDYKPTGSKTITTFHNEAKANKADMGLVDFDFWKWLMTCGLSEFKSPDARYRHGYYGMGGNGDTWSVSNGKLTGETYSVNGLFGKIAAPSDVLAVNANACHVLLMGIEDPYNWYWQMTQGVYFGNSANSAQDGTEIFIYEGNRMPSDAELATHPEGNYRQLTRVTSSGSVSEMILGDFFDIFPKTKGGSNSTYWSTYHWTNNTGQLLLWGGSSFYGSSAGLGYSYSFYAFGTSNAHFGSRLAYYGTIKGIVNN